MQRNNCNVLQIFYRTNVYRMNTIKITINYTSLCSRGVANLLYFSSLLHAYTYHCAQYVTRCIWYLDYHLHVILREHYYYLIAHNIINVNDISAVAVSVTAITSAVDDWHHCPHADWFRYPLSFWFLPRQEVRCGDWQLMHSHRISSENTSREFVRFAPVDMRKSRQLWLCLHFIRWRLYNTQYVVSVGGGGEGLTFPSICRPNKTY